MDQVVQRGSRAGAAALGQDALLAQIRRDGFALLPGVLPPDECTALGAAIVGRYHALHPPGRPFRAGGRYTGHVNFLAGPQGWALTRKLEAKGVRKLADDLLGGSARLFRVTGNLNRTGSTPQDMHFDYEPPSEAVVVNIALVPTDRRNGATEIVRGAHSGSHSYRSLHVSGRVAEAEQLAMEPGDVVIRLASLWHRGMPNRGDEHRPMLTLIYEPDDGSGSELVPEPDIAFLANRFYGRLAMLRELAEVHLAPLFHWLRMARRS